MAVTFGSGDASKALQPKLDWKDDRLYMYISHTPQTFQKILRNGVELKKISFYKPEPCDSGKRADENDIFDGCKKSPGAINWYFSEEGHFYLCLKLIEETSKDVYTLRFVDNGRGFGSHKSCKMELWDANGRKCDKALSGLAYYDSEILDILDLDRLLDGKAVVLARHFYEPEKEGHSFSLAS